MTKRTMLIAGSLVAAFFTVPQVASAQGRHAPAGGESGSAQPRDGGGGGSAAPASSQPSSPSPSPSPSSSTGSTSSTVSSGNSTGRTAGARNGSGRPQVGTAAPRRGSIRPGSPSYSYVDPYSAWWYPSIYGPAFGLGAYDLWYSGYGPNSWWYDPYRPEPYGVYRPYGYGYGSAYGYGYPYGGGSTSPSYRDDFDRHPTGSIRLRVNPKDAKVYIDGALVGTVDDFDGFSSHLDIEPGHHQLEVRAPGYAPYVTDVSVSVGKTITERANLKKTK